MTRRGSYEAKNCLPRLLDEVARGETITITKHGVPVTELARPAESSMAGVGAAAAGLRVFRSTHDLRSLTIRELIDEGRR